MTVIRKNTTITNLQGFLQWKESVAPGDCNSFRANVLSYLDHLILLWTVHCQRHDLRFENLRYLKVAVWSHWNEQCFSDKVIYTGNSTWFQICLLHGMWEPDYETSSCLQEIQLPVICFGSFIITLVLGMYLLGKALNHEEQLVIPSRELTYPTCGKGKSSSKVPWWGICYFQGVYFFWVHSLNTNRASKGWWCTRKHQCMDNLLNGPWVNSPGFFFKWCLQKTNGSFYFVKGFLFQSFLKRILGTNSVPIFRKIGLRGLRGHGGGTEAHRSRTQSQITEQRSAVLSFWEV